MNLTPARLRGEHVLFAMLAFFATVIVVNVVFVVLAVRSFPGEDVRRSYLQGLNYNATLAERRAQAALGWRAAASLIEEGGAPMVEVRLFDREGSPIDGLAVSGQLRWPSKAALDRELAFEARGRGRYRARVADLGPGRWVLRARADRGGGSAFSLEAELTWPSSN